MMLGSSAPSECQGQYPYKRTHPLPASLRGCIEQCNCMYIMFSMYISWGMPGHVGCPLVGIAHHIHRCPLEGTGERGACYSRLLPGHCNFQGPVNANTVCAGYVSSHATMCTAPCSCVAAARGPGPGTTLLPSATPHPLPSWCVWSFLLQPTNTPPSTRPKAMKFT